MSGYSLSSNLLFKLFVTACVAVAPLVYIKLPGANLTAFDVLVFFLFWGILLFNRSLPSLPGFYVFGALGFLSGAVISTISSLSASHSFSHFIQYLYSFIVVVPVGYFLGYYRSFHVSIVAGYGVACFFIFFQSYSQLAQGAAEFVAGGRYSGNYDSVGMMAFSVSLLFPFAIAIFCFPVKGVKKALINTTGGALVVMVLWVLALTGSRTAVVCVALTCLFFLFHFNKFGVVGKKGGGAWGFSCLYFILCSGLRVVFIFYRSV